MAKWSPRIVAFFLLHTCLISIQNRTTSVSMAEIGRSATWLTNCTNTTNPASNSDYRCFAIFYGRTVAASLSIAGCCLVLFVIVIYKKYRNFTHRMIVYVLLPSIVLSLIYVYPHRLEDTSRYCQITGYLVNTCTLAQRLLILFIVIHLLVFTINERRPRYMEHVFLSLACIVPLVISVFPFIGKNSHYGYAGDWCWIKGDSGYENFLRLFCLYLWMVSFIVVEFVCFVIVIVKVGRHLKRIETTSEDSPAVLLKIRQYKKQVYPLLCYPLVNMILAIPVSANRIQNAIDKENPIFGLYMMHCTIYPLWGFANAMMYFVSKETIRELHPGSVWEQLTTWRRSSRSRSSQQRLLSSPQSHQPEINEIFCKAGSKGTIGREALYSATMDSSDME